VFYIISCVDKSDPAETQ